jgi:cyclopropane-fatty-acyl-phospholipid synthase
MLYTCAYWKDGTRTLEEAQRNKLDHVGRKVLLKPGDDVVDIGSASAASCIRRGALGVKVTATTPPARRSSTPAGRSSSSA